MLEEALRLFGLTGTPTQLIRHNENLTYCVDGQYLLRIHRPRDGFTTIATDDWPAPLTLRESELTVLRCLHDAGLRVQQPIPATDGSFVARLADGTPVTLLTWLEGHMPGPESANTDTYRATGIMTARLHAALRNCPSLPVRRYDEALALHLRDVLLAHQGEGGFDRKSVAVLARACEIIGRALRRCEKDFQLIHGDLDPSNIIITANGLSPIDFSLCGLSHPMMDLALVISTVQDASGRRALAEGYRLGGGSVNFPLLDVFYALNLLLYIVLHMDELLAADWLPASLSRWRARTFDPLIAGQGLGLIDSSPWIDV